MGWKHEITLDLSSLKTGTKQVKMVIECKRWNLAALTLLVFLLFISSVLVESATFLQNHIL